jgi:hypothetical protein
LNPVGEQQDHDRGRAQHLDRLEDRDDPTPIGAIGQRATHQREQQHRRVHGERIEPDQERRRAQIEQQPRLRDLLCPGSDARKQAGEPEAAETPGRQQPQRFAEPFDQRHAW